jgi:chromosome segregation ATPase
MQNGPVSESLTRLQNGYLHVISVLDKRIDTLQEELNTARMKLNERNALSTTEATQRIAQLEAANEVLQLELEAARAQQKAWVAEIRGLKVSLETKTVVIKDSNRRILRLEQANRRLEEELKAKKQGKAQEVKAENNAESPRKKRRMSITS